jgi:hypothetical protein
MHPTKRRYLAAAARNGYNWNSLRLLTGGEHGVKGHVLRAVDFRLQTDSVLVILKKDTPKGPMVAFVEGKDLDTALELVCHAVKSVTLSWKPDKYRSMRNDKK